MHVAVAVEPTSESLLLRLRGGPADAAAWDEFVRRYGDRLLGWCRRWGLQEADAEDVVQAVLAALVDRLRRFTYDPARSFRSYLKTLTRYAVCDYIDRQKRHLAGGSGDTRVLELLAGVAARDDLEERTRAACEEAVLREAAARVRHQVTSRTWEAFRLTAAEGLSGAEAAARLGLTVAAVFKAKSNVCKRLREEAARLGADD